MTGLSEAAGRTELSRGTTDTTGRRLLSTSQTNGSKQTNKQKTTSEALTRCPSIWSAGSKVCVTTIIFPGIIGSPSKKTRNPFQSFFPLAPFSHEIEGRAERNVGTFVWCSRYEEKFMDWKVSIRRVQKHAATLFSKSTSEICIPSFVF